MEGLIIFLVAWFVVAQFVLPRFGIRPGWAPDTSCPIGDRDSAQKPVDPAPGAAPPADPS